MQTAPEPTEAAPERKQGAWHGIIPKLVVSLLVGLGFFWLLRRGGLPIVPQPSAFAGMKGWAIPLFLVLQIGGTFFRTYRWNYLLRPVDPELPRWRVFGVGLIGSSATFFAPLRSGEFVRPYLLSRDGKVSFFQAAGTVLAERIVDGLVLTLVTVAALWASTPLSPLPERLGDLEVPVGIVQAAVYAACGVFFGLFVAILVFRVAREPVVRLLDRVVGVVSPKLARFAAGTLERLSDGLRFLASPEHRGPFVRDTLLYWGCGIAAQFALLAGVGLEMTPVEACVTLGVLGLGIVVPAGPGMFGAYQLSAYTALALYVPAADVLQAGSAFVFVSYLATWVLNGVALALGLLLLSLFPAAGRARA